MSTVLDAYMRNYKINLMSNLPLGADLDPSAPYNMNEETFNINLSIKGLAWYEYYGSLDTSEAYTVIYSRILAALKQVGDIEVEIIDLELT